MDQLEKSRRDWVSEESWHHQTFGQVDFNQLTGNYRQEHFRFLESWNILKEHLKEHAETHLPQNLTSWWAYTLQVISGESRHPQTLRPDSYLLTGNYRLEHQPATFWNETSIIAQGFDCFSGHFSKFPSIYQGIDYSYFALQLSQGCWTMHKWFWEKITVLA